jgi:hypothetical protein
LTYTIGNDVASREQQAKESKMAQTYSTLSEAVYREIVEPIEAGDVEDAYADYDIDAITEQVLGDYGDGYTCKVTPEEFWGIVEDNTL